MIEMNPYYARSSSVGHVFDVATWSDGKALDAAWDEIEKLTVVQEKQFGSLSRNAGNIGASIRLRMTDGRKHEFSVDMFREDGYIIHRRIDEATEMVPADLGGPVEDGVTEYEVMT